MENTEEMLYPILVNKKYGYINKKGEIIIEPKYDYAEEFSEDLAIVGTEGNLGYINKKGKLL